MKWVWTVEGKEEALQKRARKQIEETEFLQPDGAVRLHNLWSGKEERNTGSNSISERTKRATRCDSFVDSGWTRGEANSAFFCLYFARGKCSRGWACEYKHRVPTMGDDAHASHESDCFGRSRTETFVHANKGAGNYQRDSKVLYVNWAGASRHANDVQGMIERDFSEWGPIWEVYVKHKECIAFVRYSYRYAAEFAKEAMNRQSLIESSAGEALLVRWANNDPNPVAVNEQKREREELYSERLERSDELHSPMSHTKLAKAAHKQLQGNEGEYPDTEQQYEQQHSQHEQASTAAVSAFTQWWNSLSKAQRKHLAKAYGFASSKKIKEPT